MPPLGRLPGRRHAAAGARAARADRVRAGRSSRRCACACTRGRRACARCRGRRPRTSAPATTSPASAGEGLEFADLRPHVPGDRLRQVNWRVSARRGRLHVNEYHPERNADVVLFLDSFTDTRDGTGGTIDMTVRAAAALAPAYLRTRDRVGIVGFGGVLRWVLPSSRDDADLPDPRLADRHAGRRQLRLAGRGRHPAAHAAAARARAWRSRRSPTRGCSRALADLRARGIDLAVIDVSPLPFVARRRATWATWPSALWRLQREQLGSRYRAMGVPVVEWRTTSRWTRCWPSCGRCGDTPEPCASDGRSPPPGWPRPPSPPTRRPRRAGAGTAGVTAAAVAASVGPRRRRPRPLGGRRRLGDRARRRRLRRRPRARRRADSTRWAPLRRPASSRPRSSAQWAVELARPAAVDAGIVRAPGGHDPRCSPPTGAGAGWLLLLVSNAGDGRPRASPRPASSPPRRRWCSSRASPAGT